MTSPRNESYLDTTSADAPAEADPAELQRIAKRLRSDAWTIAERWSLATEQIAPAASLRANGDAVAPFGEVPAFLAALAHALDGAPAPLAAAAAAHGLSSDDAAAFDNRDSAVRAAASDHARQRADVGYDQRDMLIEFVALRRVLWEYFAEFDRPSFAAERTLNSLLDAVIVEAVDQCFAELTDALIRRAERDPLTGLLNRQTFHDRLGREINRARRHGRRLTVVSVDLDAFKQVNDTLGHLAGDAVLKRVASLLATHTRDEDIVGRLGGDEFAVALVETESSTAAADLIRRMRIHLAPARRHFGLPREFGISYGSAVYAVDGDTVEELLFAADAGLYRAKGPGRGELMTSAGHSPTLEKVRVLVADDDAGVRALCSAVLEEAGFDVTCVADGVSAVKAAKESAPDIALIDVSMPHLDGWRVLDELSGDERTAAVPVVMLTGSADAANLDKAWKGGALDFINKPFDPEGLVASVHRVLEYDQESSTASGAPAAASRTSAA